MRSPEEMLALAEDAVREILAMGADAVEVFLSASEGTAINAIGPYASPKESRDEGLAVRVALGSRLGQSGSTGMNLDVARRVARHAMDAARRVPDSTRFKQFATPSTSLPPPTRVHPALERPDPERITDRAALASERLTAAPEVTYAGVSLHAWRSTFAVANSEGVLAWDRSAHERVLLEARVTRGTRERTAQDARTSGGPLTEALDVGAFVDGVVARARSALDSERLAKPATEVILLPSPASQLATLFLPAVNAHRLQARQSPLAGKSGEMVLSESLTMRDEPRGPSGFHHQRVDHEGVPTDALTLVDGGRFVAPLYDSAAAHAEGRASTGHGIRAGGVTGGVGIRPVNLHVPGGDATLDELIEGAERAVLVNEPMMGGFVANEVTGDFSLVAPYAFLVENGRIVHALPPTTVGGNVHRALREVRALGRESVSFTTGTFPPMRLGGVSCAT